MQVSLKNFRVVVILSALLCAFYIYTHIDNFFVQASSPVPSREFGRVAEDYFLVVFLLGAALMLVATPPLLRFRGWGYYTGWVASSLLSIHLLFTICESLTFEIILLAPVVFGWWMILYGADLCGPLMILYLRHPIVREAFKK